MATMMATCMLFLINKDKASSVFLHISVILLTLVVFFFFTGSGADGAEEIKRHGFFSTIDWNVSV